MRSFEEITRLIEVYPPAFRRWCSAPENGGCACMGCVRWPAPSTVHRDPEGAPWPNPSDALTEAEVKLWRGHQAMTVLEQMKAKLAEKFAPAIDFKAPYAKVMLEAAMVAVLEVLRDPSDAVLDAAYSEDKTTLENWQAAIDVILAEVASPRT